MSSIGTSMCHHMVTGVTGRICLQVGTQFLLIGLIYSTCFQYKSRRLTDASSDPEKPGQKGSQLQALTGQKGPGKASQPAAAAF